MPSTRARAVIAVGLAVKPVGKPDAGNPHVRFDERGRETGCCRMAQATAPVLDSTLQGPAVHGRGDPVGRALVLDVPDQLPRSRTDAAGSWGGGGPHDHLPLDPSLCARAGEADPAAPACVQWLLAGRRDIRQGEGTLDLPLSRRESMQNRGVIRLLLEAPG